MRSAIISPSKSTIVILGSIAFGLLIFALTPGPKHFVNNPTTWELREQLVYITGVCTMTLMVVSMVISARFGWVSRMMQGLDKGYVVHKWTGILSTILVLTHFLMENVPHWLVESGVIANPGELTDGTQYSELEIGLFQSGVILAQVAFYIMLLLVVMALFKRIPYHWFRKTHKIFPVVFILAAYHGATAQLKEHWLGSVGSFLLMAILLIGVVCALISLIGNIGASRTIKAEVTSIKLHGGNIFDIGLAVENDFMHEPGQYAFLTFGHDREPHPFSIASFDHKKLRFVIKALGDYTSKLPNHIEVGQRVKVEGPYGDFNFDDQCERQIWIAGGIGITPFLSRLQHLNESKSKVPIDFWYSTRGDKTTYFPISLEESCGNCGISFYHLNSVDKEYLTVETIRKKVSDLSRTSIWFCGPQAFADYIMKELRSTEFDMKNFHFDSFSMR